MLRISKLADYGTVVMAHLALQPTQSFNAKAIAGLTRIAPPTVSKILKTLARNGLVISQRGVKGGYTLAHPAKKISVAHIIHAMDGGIALTECSHGKGFCHVEHFCTIQHNWQLISNAIDRALTTVSLADIIKPMAIRLQAPLQHKFRFVFFGGNNPNNIFI